MTREKPIDWEKVDEMLEANCHGTEVAAYFNVHYNTFYRRVEQKYGMSFTEFSEEKKQKGNIPIRVSQYNKALEGDNTMLIWLGKHRLGQSEGEDPRTVSKEKEQDLTMLLAKMIKENEQLKAELNALKPQTSPVDSRSNETI